MVAPLLTYVLQQFWPVTCCQWCPLYFQTCFSRFVLWCRRLSARFFSTNINERTWPYVSGICLESLWTTGPHTNIEVELTTIFKVLGSLEKHTGHSPKSLECLSIMLNQRLCLQHSTSHCDGSTNARCCQQCQRCQASFGLKPIMLQSSSSDSREDAQKRQPYGVGLYRFCMHRILMVAPLLTYVLRQFWPVTCCQWRPLYFQTCFSLRALMQVVGCPHLEYTLT